MRSSMVSIIRNLSACEDPSTCGVVMLSRVTALEAVVPDIVVVKENLNDVERVRHNHASSATLESASRVR